MSVDTAKGPVLVVLCALEVKVGSEWRRIGGILVADGDEVCIPAEIITRFGLCGLPDRERRHATHAL